MRNKPSREYQPSLLQAASQVLVTMLVLSDHPLLVLKKILDWPAIRELFLGAFRRAGRNVDHAPGRPLDVDLYIPLLVLMLVKHLNSREMEELLAENAVARVFIDWENDARMQVRDHSNIARLMESLSEEDHKAFNALVMTKAVDLGFADPLTLSADTTAQEVPIGYPHEAGILQGLAQRCIRALEQLKQKGKRGIQNVEEHFQAVVKKAKHYHLFAKTREEKDAILKTMVSKTRLALRQIALLTARLDSSSERVVLNAVGKLNKMVDVGSQLLPQIMYWLRTGFVAKGKILHAGITEARSIVRNKAGKKVEFGFQYLIGAIGGGYLFAEMMLKPTGETKMPAITLQSYRTIFGAEATPELFVYDRGGWSADNKEMLKNNGVQKIGIQPKGRAKWCVHGRDRERVMTLRGEQEGRIGTLKTEKYGFNKPKQRKAATLRAAGQASVLSYNLNKMMRDMVSHSRAPASA